jgi:predicted DNA-binding transcriptional regulator YafY
MPLNKQALLRYRVIDRCLRDKKMAYPSLEDLQHEMERTLSMMISPSSIEKDIRAMRKDPELGFEAPIKYNRKYNGYEYTDPNYSISNVPLSDEDLSAIEFAALTLRQFEDLPLFGDFRGAVDKIFQAIDIGSALEYEDLPQVVQFEKSPKVEGTEHIETVLDCIKERKPLAFFYRKFNSQEGKNHLVHPYLLKEYRNRWYLIALQDSNELITTYALDRMAKPEANNSIAFRAPYKVGFDAQAYFEHSFGITTFKGEPEEVILSFEPLQGQYVRTQKLHETQEELMDNSQEYRIKLTVGVTIELEMAILSYGEKVRVIQPKSLRDKVEERLASALKAYKNKKS